MRLVLEHLEQNVDDHPHIPTGISAEDERCIVSTTHRAKTGEILESLVSRLRGRDLENAAARKSLY